MRLSNKFNCKKVLYLTFWEQFTSIDSLYLCVKNKAFPLNFCEKAIVMSMIFCIFTLQKK